MRLTVLGKSPSWQDAGGACSGYLLQEGETTVLLDCGNGVFGKLRQRVDYVDVDAVVLSHLHADHFLDLVPYSYALTYAPRQQPVPVPPWPGTDNPARPRLIAPPGRAECFRRVAGAFGNDDLIEKAFAIEEYDAELHAGGRPAAVLLPGGAALHPRPSPCASTAGRGVAGLRRGLQPQRGARRVRAAAATCCSSRPRCRGPSAPGVRGHLTPEEAGEHARAAGAARVVLDPHLRRARPDLGAQAGRPTRSASGWRWRARARSTRSECTLRRPGYACGRDPRARPVRQLRADAARDRRAVRRRVRAHRVPRARLLAVRGRLLHRRARRGRWSRRTWPACGSRTWRWRSAGAS